MEETIIDLDKPAQYPVLGIDIQPTHANLVVTFGPGTFLVQAVTAAQMDDICQQWQSRNAKG